MAFTTKIFAIPFTEKDLHYGRYTENLQYGLDKENLRCGLR